MQRKRKILLVAATVLLPVSLAIAGSSSPAGAAVASGPAAVNGEFNAVSASSASDAWAVGCLNASGNPDTCPEIGSNLAEHWNGKTWTRVTVPAPAVATEAHSQTLTAVADISPTDVWVIGTVDTEYAAVPEAAHWNGKTWSRMKTPSVPYEGGDAGLTAIAGSSPSSVWAVGVGGPTASYNFPVQLYWNGRKWSNETYRRLPVPPRGLRAARGRNDVPGQCVGFRRNRLREAAPLEREGVDFGIDRRRRLANRSIRRFCR
jgi:hypothetical protein